MSLQFLLIGEADRLPKTRLDVHRKEVDNTNNDKYTRSGKMTNV